MSSSSKRTGRYAWVLLVAGALSAQETFVPYEVPAGTAGNQDFGGAVGMDFNVTAAGRVTRLGVFDSGSDGLARTITARLYDRSSQAQLASLTFTPADSGDPVGGSRFLPLDPPLALPVGFQGAIVAEGYGAGELVGNQGVGAIPALTTNPGPDAISFVGGGRWGNAAAFPTNLDTGPVNRYAAGTFEFQPVHVAYEVPAGLAGTQNFAGTLGMDFDVRAEIVVTRLGVFDSASDGLALPITARLYDRASATELALLEFTPEEPGAPLGGSRFKDLSEPLVLASGFQGSIVAEGYGAEELVGNGGPAALPGIATDNGPCSIAFVGSGRWGDPGVFPPNIDGGPANRYAAGTFEYAALGSIVPTGGTAYVVPAGTAGNQAFGASLGMDFDVLETIEITRLGVFDSGSDGLALPITAQVFSRGSQSELVRLEFTPEDPGELVGGSRFKDLDPPLALPGGFGGVIVASGYGAGEMNGNRAVSALPLSTDDGGCLIEFVGTGRFGDPAAPGTFPGTVDGGAVDAYAAGTFVFVPSDVEIAAPSPPLDLVAVGGDGTVFLSWTPPADEVVEGYNVFRTSGGPPGKLNDAPVLGTTFDAVGLLNGVEACFVVRSLGIGGLESDPSDEACAAPTSGVLPDVAHIAYEVPAGTVGNQAFGGSLGKSFVTNTNIIVTRLGVFDSGSNGLALPITAVLYDRASGAELARLAFTPEDPGTLTGGSRFKDLPVPIELPAGFAATIAAFGYGEAEPAGNRNVGPLALFTDDGGCAIELDGAFFGDPDTFPAGFDANRFPHHYAAGTLEYGPRPGSVPDLSSDGVAYVFPAGAAGNQEFGGSLGMDFLVNEPVLITELGVFDDLSDGLALPIGAAVFDRASQAALATLAFTPEEPGELADGSRFKPLAAPLALPPGFEGSIVAWGYGVGERNGNTPVGGGPLGTTDDGGCLITFVGGGRFGDAAAPGSFPATVDGGPANRYGAGTFRFAFDPREEGQLAGDCDTSGNLAITDVICYVMNLFPGFVLVGSPSPAPCDGGPSSPGNLAVLNLNSDHRVDVSDLIFLCNYLYRGGPPPAQGADCVGVPVVLGCLDSPACQ